MLFNITHEMVGLKAFNAMSGDILGLSGQIIFDRRNMCFKRWIIQRDNGDKYYLEYSDILRINDKAILCLFEDKKDKGYDHRSDPDAVTFIGSGAVNASDEPIGVVSSVKLDSETGAIKSIQVLYGENTLYADMDMFMGFTDDGRIKLRCDISQFDRINENPEDTSQTVNTGQTIEHKAPVLSSIESASEAEAITINDEEADDISDINVYEEVIIPPSDVSDISPDPAADTAEAVKEKSGSIEKLANTVQLILGTVFICAVIAIKLLF